jgi:pyridoxal phosphate phosphatase PHOSPHO2
MHLPLIPTGAGDWDARRSRAELRKFPCVASIRESNFSTRSCGCNPVLVRPKLAMDPPPAVLFVWDFDETIVLANTDTLVFERLCPSLLTSIVHGPPPRPSWTARMDTGLAALAARGHTPAAVIDAVAQAPLPADTRAALQAIAAHPRAASAILSDANSLYISAILDRADLNHAFAAGIFTNPARIVQADVATGPGLDHGAAERITVAPRCGDGVPGAVDGPHGCKRCSANLCKGKLLDALVKRYDSPLVCYIGDGGNDACPAMRVRAGGVVMPRKGFTLEKLILGKVGDSVAGGRGEPRVALQDGVDVSAWSTSPDLRAGIQALLVTMDERLGFAKIDRAGKNRVSEGDY